MLNVLYIKLYSQYSAMENPRQKQQQLDQLLASNPQFSKQHIEKNMKLPLQMCEQGRQLLKESNYLQASKCFSKAVMAFEFLLKNGLLSKEQTKQMFLQIMIPTYSNLSLCYLKLGSYESVIPLCNQILDNDSSHVKSKYRRGLAYKNLKKFDEAIQNFVAAGQLDPSIKIQCDALVKDCKAQIAKEKTRERKIASAFITNIQDERLNGAQRTQTQAKIQNPGWLKSVANWVADKCSRLWRK